MDSRVFWRTVHEELDAGRDPLDEEVVAAWLAEHPEELEAFADLRAGLASVAAAAARSGPRAWRWRIGWPAPAAVAAAALLALCLPWGNDGGEAAPVVRVHRLTVTYDDGVVVRGTDSRPGRRTTVDALLPTRDHLLRRLSLRTEVEHSEEEP